MGELKSLGIVRIRFADCDPIGHLNNVNIWSICSMQEKIMWKITTDLPIKNMHKNRAVLSCYRKPNSIPKRNKS